MTKSKIDKKIIWTVEDIIRKYQDKPTNRRFLDPDEVKKIIELIKQQLVKGSASYKVADEIEKRLKLWNKN